jgi:hypothetical protein
MSELFWEELARKVCNELDIRFPRDLSNEQQKELEDAILQKIRSLKVEHLTSGTFCIEEDTEWEPIDCESLPLPPYDLQSPVIQLTLETWSNDKLKVSK